MKFVQPTQMQTDTSDEAIEQSGRFFTNDETIPDDITIASGKNTFVCGPANFTGTIEVNGVLNVI